ncbi:nucleotidyltransferase family protein isoform 4 [Tanacetum coccineum]|uniref:Nucleotidyltransferase family protein isoform 4 n=1 Tax=Tanacetum coccineum TaxID=301880 RepID=A0ABQ4Z5V5_9ASTR
MMSLQHTKIQAYALHYKNHDMVKLLEKHGAKPLGSGVYINRERGYSIDPIYIDNPLFPANNVGRNCFRIHQCIKAFADAYSTLEDQLAVLSDNYVKEIRELDQPEDLAPMITFIYRGRRGGAQISLINMVVELHKLCCHPFMLEEVEPDDTNEFYKIGYMNVLMGKLVAAKVIDRQTHASLSQISQTLRSSSLSSVAETMSSCKTLFPFNGFAFVYFEDERDAEDAINALDNTAFGYDKHKLSVKWARVLFTPNFSTSHAFVTPSLKAEKSTYNASSLIINLFNPIPKW